MPTYTCPKCNTQFHEDRFVVKQPACPRCDSDTRNGHILAPMDALESHEQKQMRAKLEALDQRNRQLWINLFERVARIRRKHGQPNHAQVSALTIAQLKGLLVDYKALLEQEEKAHDLILEEIKLRLDMRLDATLDHDRAYRTVDDDILRIPTLRERLDQVEDQIDLDGEALRNYELEARKRNRKLKEEKATLAECGLDYLYHITSIDNLPSILEKGILSNLYADPIFLQSHRRIDISDHQVQARRANRKDTVHSRHLHLYAPLYFNPRNPMLYRLKCTIGQDKLAILGVDALQSFDEQAVFTDGNAASGATRFYHGIDNLRLLPWALIRAERWCRHSDAKRVSCAEVLVYPKVYASRIKKIWFIRKERTFKLKKVDTPVFS